MILSASKRRDRRVGDRKEINVGCKKVTFPFMLNAYFDMNWQKTVVPGSSDMSGTTRALWNNSEVRAASSYQILSFKSEMAAVSKQVCVMQT